MVKEVVMETATKSLVSLFVDRASSECWEVCDAEGNFRLVPPVDSPGKTAGRFIQVREWISPQPFH